MRVVMFYHSLVSDWNHGNAHFLRGIATELVQLGCSVSIWEPAGGWSKRNLLHDHGPAALEEFRAVYPQLDSREYSPGSLDLETELAGADLVLVHEWNDPALVNGIGAHRERSGSYCLMFHDTHHRAVTDPAGISAFDLRGYDGVLAFGNAVAKVYLANGWARRVWTWHEAADTRVFRPLPVSEKAGDLVWIGNWGDGERSAELREFLIEPVRRLGLRARVYGVRYPEHAIRELDAAGIEYAGWLPNWRVPEVFSRYRVTVHVPRRPYVNALPGIPTIRVFEAMACGIPLVSAPWHDAEGLFRAGRDYLIARDGAEMTRQLGRILADPGLASELAASAGNRIAERHSCAHRAGELMKIYSEAAPAGAQSLPTGTTSR